jgi:alkaline phosphatase
MTQKAIELLDNPKGFVLQVEAGRVDHAGHSNDFAGLLFDQRDYEEAVKTAVEFAERDGDTLVIITTDHATGGPSLNGLGAEYTESNAALDAWQGMSASYEVMQPSLMRAASAADAHDIVKSSLGFDLTQEESAALAACAKGQFPVAGSRLLSNLTASLGLILSNHNCVSWTSTNHTSEHVLLSAFGPGAHRLAGLVDNTDLFDAMTAALDIRHRNPLVSPAEARRAAEVSAHFWNENHA